MTQIVVDGVALNVRDDDTDGPGPPLLILHGFTGSIAAMEPLTSRLRPRHRTIAVDLVGHGGSDAPGDPRAFSPHAVVSQLAGIIDHVADGPVIPVGYSMGGRMALTLACTRPDLVAAVVAIGASAGLADEAGRRERREADEALARSLERDGLETFVDQWMALPLFATQARLGAESLAAIRRQKLANSARGLAASLRGTGTGSMAPLHDPLARSSTPFLFVAGELDVRYRAIAVELAALTPDGRSLIVTGSGHAAHVERPDDVARAVSAFVADVRRASRP